MYKADWIFPHEGLIAGLVQPCHTTIHPIPFPVPGPGKVVRSTSKTRLESSPFHSHLSLLFPVLTQEYDGSAHLFTLLWCDCGSYMGVHDLLLEYLRTLAGQLGIRSTIG